MPKITRRVWTENWGKKKERGRKRGDRITKKGTRQGVLLNDNRPRRVCLKAPKNKFVPKQTLEHRT